MAAPAALSTAQVGNLSHSLLLQIEPEVTKSYIQLDFGLELIMYR